jgi:c-di-GMP-binding flagellar brake protein YcgR
MIQVGDMVKIGEIFEVGAQGVCVHTKLQEMHGDGEFSVLQPTLKGVPLNVDDGAYQFSFFRPNGVYTFGAKLVLAYEKANVKLCRFRQVSEIEKIQRRQCYRLPIVLNAIIQNESDDEPKKYKGRTTTLSEKSVKLTCFTPFPEETKLSVKIFFSETETITLRGKVLKCSEPLVKNDPYEIVILFLDSYSRHITRLSRYIFKQQIIARNKKSKEHS